MVGVRPGGRRVGRNTIHVLAAKKGLGKVRMGLVGVRPGGRRDGRILRFAEADTASASAFRLCAFNTALARKGLAVFQALRAFRRARLRSTINENR